MITPTYNLGSGSNEESAYAMQYVHTQGNMVRDCQHGCICTMVKMWRRVSFNVTKQDLACKHDGKCM